MQTLSEYVLIVISMLFTVFCILNIYIVGEKQTNKQENTMGKMLKSPVHVYTLLITHSVHFPTAA